MKCFDKAPSISLVNVNGLSKGLSQEESGSSHFFENCLYLFDFMFAWSMCIDASKEEPVNYFLFPIVHVMFGWFFLMLLGAILHTRSLISGQMLGAANL